MNMLEKNFTHLSPEPLFQPFESGSLKLKNRLAMAPMSRYQCPDNIPTDAMVAYYTRRAKGGLGLIISEATYIDHPSAASYEGVPNFFGKEALQGWRRVLDAVHAENVCMFPQLWHVGHFRDSGQPPDPTVPGYAPSAVLNEFNKNTHPPKAMDETDIAEVIDAYARGARDAEQLGFDGVEIHGAHGYLIDEFFWSATNKRTDRYGGSLANRVRFATEVIAAIRKTVSPHFPVAIRLSQWKQQEFDARLADTPEELEQILLPLVDAGIDIFHGSTRCYWQSEFPQSELNFAGWCKKITGLPTLTVGSVGLTKPSFKHADTSDINELIERLERQEFDLISVGRALLAEPDWPKKIRAGEYDTITAFDSKFIQEYS